MFRLTREVRFAVPAGGDPAWVVAGDNSFAAKPPVDGLCHYLTLSATITGDPLPDVGYIRNIKDVDVALRDDALPRVAAAIHDNTFGGGANLVVSLFADLADAFPGNPLADVTLAFSPLTRLTTTAENPDMVRLTQSFEFAAGHRLHNPALSDDENRRLYGKCNNPHMHGHNYIFEVTLQGRPRDDGRLIDMADFERTVDERVVDAFDHRNLNVEVEEFQDGEGGGLNPSVENIAMVVYRRLKDALPMLAEVKVWETPKTSCAYSE